MTDTATSRLAISLPVVVDFQGTLARGVTQDLDLHSLSFWSDCQPALGTSVSVLFHFGRNTAYLPLTGQVAAITQDINETTSRFRTDLSLSSLGHAEERILESAFQELETYLRSLDESGEYGRAAAREQLITSNPRSILSVFVTDNPYRLPYRLPVGTSTHPDTIARQIGSMAISQSHAKWKTESDPAPLLSKTPPVHISWRMAWQSVGLLAQVLRDLAVRYLPSRLARLLVTPIGFAFIGHPRTLNDVPRKFPFARLLPSRVVERWFRYQWPFVASYITGLTLSNGTPITGAAALRPRTPPPLPDWAAWAPQLPEPIRQACLDYVQRRLPNWSPLRQRLQALKFLGDFQRFWDWQLARRALSQPADLHLADLQAYQSQRVTKDGVTTTTVNRVVSYVLTALQEQAEAGVPIDPAIFRLRRLPEPHRLPRCLPESDCQRLDAFVQTRLDSPDPLVRLENACFLVLAHTGLRASECVYLQVGDLDLTGRRLVIRQGKGRKERAIYLSDTAALALARYLGETPRPANAPLWVRPNGRPIKYEWLLVKMTALGQAAGVAEVTPHRLRHSLATRLLNAGMDITRIQKLLGHTQLSTTQVYAQVLDVTLEADYRRAMTKIEQQSQPLSDEPVAIGNWPVGLDTRQKLGQMAY